MKTKFSKWSIIVMFFAVASLLAGKANAVCDEYDGCEGLSCCYSMSAVDWASGCDNYWAGGIVQMHCNLTWTQFECCRTKNHCTFCAAQVVSSRALGPCPPPF